ncbi:thioesterase II family protein [Actinomadura sediminis]|uniref:Thioesterase II family protein n=1 Tax=Actinomadura sediminis TaxID=1038904 RepID=A0ABW3EZ34_9ACTN
MPNPVGDLWIRRFHPSAGATARLVCFPHAGGAASFFRPVSAALAPDVEVLALQYPGRQDRRAETPVRDLHRLADETYAALRPHLGDRPAFFGHSMGAALAYEVALRAERDGLGPRVLVASGRRAPSRHRTEDVHRRDDDGIIAEIRGLNGTESRVLDEEEILRAALPALRADYHAIETYRTSGTATLSCPVAVFVGDADPQVTPDEARAWREHTSGALELHTFRGGHFYLTARPAETIDRLVKVLHAHG